LGALQKKTREKGKITVRKKPGGYVWKEGKPRRSRPDRKKGGGGASKKKLKRKGGENLKRRSRKNRGYFSLSRGRTSRTRKRHRPPRTGRSTWIAKIQKKDHPAGKKGEKVSANPARGGEIIETCKRKKGKGRTRLPKKHKRISNLEGMCSE